MLQRVTGSGAGVRPLDRQRRSSRNPDPDTIGWLRKPRDGRVHRRLLVRHLENADHLLDPYFTEPFIWLQEFARVVNEVSGLSANSEGLVAPERRNWSLREAAMFMVVRAKGERIVELRALGETLILNARRLIEPAQDHEPRRRSLVQGSRHSSCNSGACLGEQPRP